MEVPRHSPVEDPTVPGPERVGAGITDRRGSLGQHADWRVLLATSAGRNRDLVELAVCSPVDHVPASVLAFDDGNLIFNDR